MIPKNILNYAIQEQQVLQMHSDILEETCNGNNVVMQIHDDLIIEMKEDTDESAEG